MLGLYINYMNLDNNFRIFAIGASSGGYRAVKDIFSNVPKGLNAAFMVVLHSSFNSSNSFVQSLSKVTHLNVLEAKNNMVVDIDTIYLAKPNHHLFVGDGVLKLSKGPRENLFRPSIDVLFRSAAVSCKNRCVGILLTGRLNDGTNGLDTIQKCGGLAVIENPDTAEFSSMPLYAKETLDIDYVVNLEDIPQVIISIASEPLPEKREVPNYIRRENSIAMSIKSQISLEEELGDQVPISCASCGGPLWEMKNGKIKRYRCHVGHAFTQEALLKSQDASIEEALWVSIRTLEEKRMLMEAMQKDYTKRGLDQLIKSYDSKIKEITEHIENLKTVLQLND